MSRNRFLSVKDGRPVGESLALARPGTIFTPIQAALLRATALPLMGRYADNDGPLQPEEAPPVPQASGNRRQRRAAQARR